MCVCFALKHASKTALMKGLNHIVLSVLVCLTDTMPKHNGPKQIYFKNYTFCPEDISFHIVM